MDSKDQMTALLKEFQSEIARLRFSASRNYLSKIALAKRLGMTDRGLREMAETGTKQNLRRPQGRTLVKLINADSKLVRTELKQVAEKLLKETKPEMLSLIKASEPDPPLASDLMAGAFLLKWRWFWSAWNFRYLAIAAISPNADLTTLREPNLDLVVKHVYGFELEKNIESAEYIARGAIQGLSIDDEMRAHRSKSVKPQKLNLASMFCAEVATNRLDVSTKFYLRESGDKEEMKWLLKCVNAVSKDLEYKYLASSLRRRPSDVESLLRIGDRLDKLADSLRWDWAACFAMLHAWGSGHAVAEQRARNWDKLDMLEYIHAGAISGDDDPEEAYIPQGYYPTRPWKIDRLAPSQLSEIDADIKRRVLQPQRNRRDAVH